MSLAAGLFTRRPAGCSPAGVAAKIAALITRLSAGVAFPVADGLERDGLELRGQARAGDAVVLDAAGRGADRVPQCLAFRQSLRAQRQEDAGQHLAAAGR